MKKYLIKIFALVLCLVLAISLFAGCSKRDAIEAEGDIISTEEEHAQILPEPQHDISYYENIGKQNSKNPDTENADTSTGDTGEDTGENTGEGTGEDTGKDTGKTNTSKEPCDFNGNIVINGQDFSLLTSTYNDVTKVLKDISGNSSSLVLAPGKEAYFDYNITDDYCDLNLLCFKNYSGEGQKLGGLTISRIEFQFLASQHINEFFGSQDKEMNTALDFLDGVIDTFGAPDLNMVDSDAGKLYMEYHYDNFTVKISYRSDYAYGVVGFSVNE